MRTARSLTVSPGICHARSSLCHARPLEQPRMPPTSLPQHVDTPLPRTHLPCPNFVADGKNSAQSFITQKYSVSVSVSLSLPPDRRPLEQGNVFTEACVILFTGGVFASVHAGIPPPDAGTPPGAGTSCEQASTKDVRLRHCAHFSRPPPVWTHHQVDEKMADCWSQME